MIQPSNFNSFCFNYDFSGGKLQRMNLRHITVIYGNVSFCFNSKTIETTAIALNIHEFSFLEFQQTIRKNWNNSGIYQFRKYV